MVMTFKKSYDRTCDVLSKRVGFIFLIFFFGLHVITSVLSCLTFSSFLKQSIPQPDFLVINFSLRRIYRFPLSKRRAQLRMRGNRMTEYQHFDGDFLMQIIHRKG